MTWRQQIPYAVHVHSATSGSRRQHCVHVHVLSCKLREYSACGHQLLLGERRGHRSELCFHIEQRAVSGARERCVVGALPNILLAGRAHIAQGCQIVLCSDASLVLVDPSARLRQLQPLGLIEYAPRWGTRLQFNCD